MSFLLRVLSVLSILFHPIHVSASVQQFTLVVQETWVHGKLMITANGTLPGPTLTVNEDDDVVVTVINALPNAFTTIHWHGMFQYGTSFFDGAVGVTQCAIGKTQRMTYQFKAKPAGTFWYHGHVNGQLIDGLYGALIVKSSYDAMANAQYQYNQNEWIWMISDWYHAPVAALRPKFLSSQNTHAMEPLPDGFMLNQFVSSKLRYNTTAPTTPSFYIGYNQTVRIRLINAAAVSMYSVSLDGLAMTIIEIDGVAVSPVTVSSVMLDAGQRVSVIVRMSELNVAVPTPWRSSHLSSAYPSIYARIESITSMFGVDDDMYRAYYNPSWQFDPFMFINIVTDPINRTKQPSYNATTIKPQPGVEVVMPMPWNVTGTMTTADMEMMTMMGIDENCLSCRPIERQNAPSATHHLYLHITQSNDVNGIPRYYLNQNTFRMEDDMSSQPLLYQMITTALQGNMSTPSTTSAPTHMPDMNPTTSNQMPPHHMPGMDMGTTTPPTTHMPGMTGDNSPTHSAGGSTIHQNYTLLVADRFDLPFNTTVEIFINNTDTLSHPMHLHGHHFWVIATSSDPSAETQYAPNYIRRDTAVVPAQGWLKIRFNTNNPGVWLLHCHMEWHMMAGLSTVITTGLPHLANLLRSTLPPQQLMEPCMKQNNWTLPNSVTGGMTGMTGMTGTTGMTGMTGTHGGGHNGSSHSHFPIHASVLTLLLIVVIIIITQ